MAKPKDESGELMERVQMHMPPSMLAMIEEYGARQKPPMVRAEVVRAAVRRLLEIGLVRKRKGRAG